MLKNPKLSLIYGITFIDAVVTAGLGPMFSKYTESLSGKTVWVMAGTALLLGSQLLFAPILGALSDTRGRRPMLIVTAIGSVLATFFLLPVKVWGYLGNRTMEGATNGMASVLRSAVVDSAEEGDVVQQTGVQGSIIALGAVFGPALGGILIIALPQARYDPMPLVTMVMVLAIINVGLTVFFKETSTKEKQPIDIGKLKEKAINSLNVKRLWSQLDSVDEKLPGFRSLFMLQLLGVGCIGHYNYFIAYLISGNLNLTYQQAAFFFIYYSLITVVTNLVFFQLLVKHIDHRKMMVLVTLLGIGVMGLYAFSDGSPTMLYVTGTLDALTLGQLAGLIGGMISQLTSKGDGQGSIFGDTQALGGVASFVAALATTLLTAVDPRAPFAFYALAMALLAYRAYTLPAEAAAETHPANQR